MRLVHSVKLKFFEDEANGEWGLAHENAINNDSPFNAFYNGTGIFHDVFEHYFEERHKYFKGDYSFNVGGEMAAMGHLMYYYEVLNLYNRLESPFHTYGEVMRNTTESEIREAIQYGYCKYGETLESSIPYQPPVESNELEWQIEKLNSKIQTTPVGDHCCSDCEIEYAKNYKKSATFSKIANLHRWGYKKAKRLISNNHHNKEKLYEFIKYWDDFCKRNEAKDLSDFFRGIEFKIYKEKESIEWKAILDAYYPYDDFEIDSRHHLYVPYSEELIVEESY